MRVIDEKGSVKDSVKAMQGNFGGDNSSQMKGVQILKFLATSDDKLANEFMKKLNPAMTSISKEVLGDKSSKKESIIVKGNGTMLDIDDTYSVELEEGKEYILREKF